VSRGETRGRSESSCEGHNRWTRRPLLFAIFLILILTLFPFQFLPQETASRRALSVFRWLSIRPTGVSDFLENVLLFAPFGFGLACWRGESGRLRFLRAVAAGAAFSCLIEYLQVFLPTRTASWWDVIGNTLGSTLGYLIFESAGEALLRAALAVEVKTAQFFTGRRSLAVFVVYIGLMLVISATLQQSTSLTHWAKNDWLWVGNDATQRHPWQGQILRVEMNNEVAAPEYFRRDGTAARPEFNSQTVTASNLLLDLDVSKGESGNVGFRAEKSAEGRPEMNGAQAAIGSLRGDRPAMDLIRQLQKTNRFTLWVRCVPSAAAEKSFGTIVSLSRDSRHVDFFLAEVQKRWDIGLRSALAGNRRTWRLTFANDLEPGEPQEVVVTYNGADLSAWVNGKQATRPLRLNAGANLVYCFKGIDPYNVYGYGLLYDCLVFVPLGFALAFGARVAADRTRRRWAYFAVEFLLPPLLLEAVLFLVSHRPFQVGNVIVGICLILGAFLILNSDLVVPCHATR
jgi:glycopeptide antibiotics resistance protein